MQKVDVLLAVPPPYLIEILPLGASYLSQHLKNEGFSACVLDANILTYRRTRRKNLRAYNRLS